MLRLRNLEVLEDKVYLGIYSGKLSLNLTHAILEPLDSLPLLLEASITVVTERSHQGVRKLKENLLLYLLGKGLNSGWHSRNSTWTGV